MTRIISLANQKGGVAKSTTVQNLAGALTLKGKKVLIVDLDPQANTTQAFGYTQDNLDYTIYDCLAKDVSINNIIIKTELENLYLVPADINLTRLEADLVSEVNRMNLLENALSNLIETFEFIIIDCPPSLGILSINALICSNSVIVPVEASVFSLSGFQQIFATFELVKNINPNLELEGILLTRVESNTNAFKSCYEQLVNAFGDKCYNIYIPRNQALSDAQNADNFSDGKPKPAVFSYPSSKGAQMYSKLAEEIIKNG